MRLYDAYRSELWGPVQANKSAQPADAHRPPDAMSRPRSVSTGPAAAASRRRRSALTYDDLPKEIKLVIHCVKRAEFSSTMPPRRALRRAREDSNGTKISRSRCGRDREIEAPSELLCLERVATLRVLELGPNPIQDASELGDYRSFVVSLFPRLRWCDGHAVTVEDRSEADAFAGSKAGEVARHGCLPEVLQQGASRDHPRILGSE